MYLCWRALIFRSEQYQSLAFVYPQSTVPTVTFRECCEVGVYVDPCFTIEETEAGSLRYLTQITAGVKECLKQILEDDTASKTT